MFVRRKLRRLYKNKNSNPLFLNEEKLCTFHKKMHFVYPAVAHLCSIRFPTSYLCDAGELYMHSRIYIYITLRLCKRNPFRQETLPELYTLYTYITSTHLKVYVPTPETRREYFYSMLFLLKHKKNLMATEYRRGNN